MTNKSRWLLFEWATKLFLILFFSAFLLWIKDFSSATEVKKVAFFLICGGYAAALVLLAIEGMIVGSFSLRQLWEKLRPNAWSQRLMSLFILFTLLSVLFSAHPRIAWLGGSRGEGAVTFLIYFLCFYGVAKFARPGRWMLYFFGAIDEYLGYDSYTHNGMGEWPKGEFVVKYAKNINFETFQTCMMVDDEGQQLTEGELEIIFEECEDDAEGIKLLGTPSGSAVRGKYPDLLNLLQMASEPVSGMNFPEGMTLNLMIKDSDLGYGNWKKTKAYLG